MIPIAPNLMNKQIKENRKITKTTILYGKCAFPQNLDTRKLGEVLIFYTVPSAKKA